MVSQWESEPQDFADWLFASMKVLIDIQVLCDGKVRTNQRAIPIEDYLASLPPPKSTAGTSGTHNPPDDAPVAPGSKLVAAEPWMYPHIVAARDRTREGHGRDGRRHPLDIGDVPVDDGDLEPLPEEEFEVIDVYTEMHRARALCVFPDLLPVFKVKPLGGEDVAERMHVAYDAYRGIIMGIYWPVISRQT